MVLENNVKSFVRDTITFSVLSHGIRFFSHFFVKSRLILYAVQSDELITNHSNVSINWILLQTVELDIFGPKTVKPPPKCMQKRR